MRTARRARRVLPPRSNASPAGVISLESGLSLASILRFVCDMTKRTSGQSGGGPNAKTSHSPGATPKQGVLFPIQPIEPWRILSSDRLPLKKETYEKIRECYRIIFDSFLPGRTTVPFYTQISEQLKVAGVNIGPRALARFVSRARRVGIDDFPDPSTRTVKASSLDAAKLQSPVGSVRMSMDAHNAFAEIYRNLLRTWRKSREAGKGFFAQR